MHRSACVLAALRARHCVHTSVACGRVTQHVFELPEGHPCAVCRQHAALVEGANGLELVVRSLTTRRVTLSLAMPGSIVVAEPMEWRCGDTSLAIPYRSGAEAGVLVVDTTQGSLRLVSVPVPEGTPEHVSAFLSQWSRKGQLLVDLQSPEGAATLAVISSAGELSTAAMPAFDGQPAEIFARSWSPCADYCFLHIPKTEHAWLWEVGRPQPMPLNLEAGFEIDFFHWCFAYPASGGLLLGEETGSSALFWGPHGQVLQQIGRGGRWAAAWGSKDRIVAVVCRPGSEEGSANFYTFRGGSLSLVAELSLGVMSFCRGPSQSHPCVSPDGCLVVIPVSRHQTALRDGIAICSMDAHLLQLHAVNFCPERFAWSADSASVLVTNWAGTSVELLEYAQQDTTCLPL